MDLDPRTDETDASDRTETIVPRAGSSDSGQALTPRTPSQLPDDSGDPVEPLIEGDPDRYSSQGEHARGGLGRVLRARDHRLGRTVAIKELLRTSVAGEARFVREALVTARLQHPSIVPVHEAGRWPNGDPYYVMKLISGRSLKELIRGRSALSERVALLPNVIAVAEAIAYAHSEGVIHRDIKPANVMIGEFGETVVVDWGIARDRRVPAEPDDGAPESAAREDAGSATAGVLGTPAYMSPEQAAGEDVDERTDVYALGALLYEVLAGVQPYAHTDAPGEGGDSPDSGDVLARVLAGPPRPLEQMEPAVPPELLAVVRKAMMRERGSRYAGAKAFAEDLKRYQTGKLVTAHQYSTLTLAKRWMWRNRALVLVVGLALAVVAVLGALGVNQVVEERNAARAERTQAEEATRITELKRLQLLMLQAKSSLDRDPTAAVAWLKTYPESGPAFGQIRAMIDEAEARGVARHVFPLEDWGFGVAFSPKGGHLAAVGKDGKVRLFDVSDGSSRVLATMAGPQHAVAFSPDGRAMAVGGQRGAVAVVPLAEPGAEPLPMKGPVSPVQRVDKGEVVSIVFSPSGSRIVSIAGMGLNQFQIWDATSMKAIEGREGRSNVSADGRLVVTFGPTDQVPVVIAVESGDRFTGPALSRPPIRVAVAGAELDTALIAATDLEGEVWLLERGPRPAWRVVGKHPSKIDNLQFSPSRRLVVTMGYDKTIRLMPTAAPTAEAKPETRVLRGHDDAIYMVAFSPDERIMVSAGDDATARVWDLEGGQSRALRGHEDDVYAVALSPDGATVATIGLDSTARVWNTDVGGGRVLTRGGGQVGFVDFVGDQVVTHSYDGGVQRWDVGTGESRTIGGADAPRWLRRPMECSRDHRRTAGIFGEGQVQIWDVDQERTFELVADTAALGYATSVELSPDSARAVVTYKRGAVTQWDLATLTPTVMARGELPSDASYSPDGSELAVAHAGGVTRWDLARQEVLGQHAIVDGGAIHPDAVIYSPDGRWLALVARRGYITVLDRSSGESRALVAGDDMFTDVAFSPDGRWVAAAGADRQVRLWSAASGQMRLLRGHTDLVLRVVFSPDSRTLASASYDKTVRLWQLDGHDVRILRGHLESVDTLAFSPDGATLATGSRDGTARLWPIASAFAGGSPTEIGQRLRQLTTAVIQRADRPETAP